RDQPRGGSWLPAELGHAPGDVDHHVRIAGEHAIDPREVLGVAADMGDDEGRAGLRRYERLERCDERAEGREVSAAIRPFGLLEQLFEPFVPAICRVPE